MLRDWHEDKCSVELAVFAQSGPRGRSRIAIVEPIQTFACRGDRSLADGRKSYLLLSKSGKIRPEGEVKAFPRYEMADK